MIFKELISSAKDSLLILNISICVFLSPLSSLNAAALFILLITLDIYDLLQFFTIV